MTEKHCQTTLVGKTQNEAACAPLVSGNAANFFEIHVKGHLSPDWSDWLDGLEVKCLDNGEMILYGAIIDQAALMGVLNKLYRLNLTLLSVCQVTQKN